jgi:hypothetical protein
MAEGPSISPSWVSTAGLPNARLALKGTPALAEGPGWPPAAVAADRACADGDAELEQLTADALGAPVRVLTRHGGDQRPDLRLQARPSQPAAGTPAPEQAPALAVPAQHGLVPDQEEVASPVPVEAADEKSEKLVSGDGRRLRPCLRDAPLRDRQRPLPLAQPDSGGGHGHSGRSYADVFGLRAPLSDARTAYRLRISPTHYASSASSGSGGVAS